LVFLDWWFKKRDHDRDNPVVDDEQRIIDLAKMYLEKEGYRVTSAIDGAIAPSDPAKGRPWSCSI
jgi:PleD family two-component response regulator